jgi:Flp pilus assembly pilin Flp
MSLIRYLLSALRKEAGSQTIEYGLILVLAATIASLGLAWARKGAVTSLLDGVLKHVRTFFGIG